MVPSGKETDAETTNNTECQSECAATAEQARGEAPSIQKATDDCLPLVCQKLSSTNLSKDAQKIILSSLRPGTQKQYLSYLKRWNTYCTENKVSVLCPKVEQVIEFLTMLYRNGLGYGAINTARSSLSSIIFQENGLPSGEHPLIRRFLKGIFELRPSLPKYSFIWDVNEVFTYFKTFPALENVSLKNLSYKAVTLLCLVTGQRCQTIHTMDINMIQSLSDRMRITIHKPIENNTTR